MNTDERIQQAADAATTGLTGDPELRLEIRAELLTHFEDKLDELAEDSTLDAETVDQALKTFGPIEKIADRLVIANRHRMRLRALARWSVRVALVPVAVILAVGLGVASSRRFSTIYRLLVPRDIYGSLFHQRLARTAGLSRDQVFQLVGDMERDDRPARKRAVWERYSDDRRLYAEYVVALRDKWRTDHGGTRIDAKIPTAFGRTMTPEDLTFFEKEIRRGERLDPDNGFYNYTLAALLAQRSCRIATQSGQFLPTDKNDTFTVLLHDRDMLKKAMHELRRACEKPRFTAYAAELRQERLGWLVPPRNIEAKLAAVLITSWSAFGSFEAASYHQYRDLGVALHKYATLLIDDGQTAKAHEVLQMWRILPPLILHEPTFLVMHMVMARLNGPESPLPETRAMLFHRLGANKFATRARTDAERLGPESAQITKTIQRDVDCEKVVNKIRSMMYMMFMPAEPREGVLQAQTGRLLGYIVAAQFFLSGLIVVLVTVMGALAIVAWRWRWTNRLVCPPLMLLPSFRWAIACLAGGVVVPILLFVLYASYAPWAKRGSCLTMTSPKPLAQGLVFGFAIIQLTLGIAARAVRAQCATLGIRTPAPGLCWLRILAWSAALALLAWISVDVYKPPAIWVTRCAEAFWVGLGLLTLARWWHGRGFGLYYGTLARSLIPVLAAMTLLLGFAGNACLKHRETELLRRDRVLLPSSKTGLLRSRIHRSKEALHTRLLDIYGPK